MPVIGKTTPFDQVIYRNEARPVVSEIYTIVDEVILGGIDNLSKDKNDKAFGDFLVDVDQFITYGDKHDGFFKGCDNFDQFKSLINDLRKLTSDPIYVSIVWFTRTKKIIWRHRK